MEWSFIAFYCYTVYKVQIILHSFYFDVQIVHGW